MNKIAAEFWLGGLLLVALTLRVWGIYQGYPEFYGHVDEVGVAASIWNFFRAATLLPTEFTYPAFYSYLVAASLWCSYWLGAGPPGDNAMEGLVLLSYIDPAWVALVGRSVSVVVSTLTLLVIFLLGKAVNNQKVGLLAVLFAAFAQVPIQQAHRALPDSTMAFLATLCFYFSWRIYQRGGWSDYLLAGAMAGLVVATKYNGAFTALAIVAAHLLRRLEGQYTVSQYILSRRFWVCVITAFAMLFIGSPYLFLAYEKYWSLISYQVSALDFALEEKQPWWWIITGLVRIEYVLGVLMLAGTAYSLHQRRAWDWLLLAAWVPSFLYIGSWTRESLHYLVHFYPVLALGAARLVYELIERRPILAQWTGRGWGVAICCIMPNVYAAIQADSELAKPDTRSQAANWIEENIPSGSKIAMTWLPYCPRLALEPARRNIRRYYQSRPDLLLHLDRVWDQRAAYHLVNLEIWLKRPVVPEAYKNTVDLKDPETVRVFRRGWRSLRQLRQAGVQYIVLPGAAYGRYLDMAAPPPGTAAHYHYLKNNTYFKNIIAPENLETERLVRFTSGSQVRGGTIEIYRLLGQ